MDGLLTSSLPLPELTASAKALAPIPPTSVFPLDITIEPIIETDLFPTFTIGMEVKLRHANLIACYQLRRRWLVGIGILFR